MLKATAADLVDPDIARAEPRLLELVGRETSIPVPDVFGYCDRHEEYPAPFYLLEYVEGVNYENRSDELPADARETVVRQAGRNLAELHALGPLDRIGRIGVDDGELAVLADESATEGDFHDYLLASYEETVDTFDSGGYFPEMADDPERFADLMPDLRAYLRETVPELPSPAPPTYNHSDYRYGNLLVDSDTGNTRAVLDWANLSAGAPAYNLATTESLLLSPDRDSEARTAALRRLFREVYADARDGWTFDEAVRDRMRVYRLCCRLDAMACLPLWMAEATPGERDERAGEHREFLSQYL